MDSRGRVTFLTEAPSRLAPLVGQRVRVRGLLSANRLLLRPHRMRLWQDGAWAYVPF